MNYDRLNRRVHLYLGLFLLPWLLMYGVSSFLIIHRSWLGPADPLLREPLFKKSYNRSVPAREPNNSPALRAVAAEILKDCDLEGAFWVSKPTPDTLRIDRFNFRNSIRLTYSIKNQTLEAEREPMRPSQIAVRLHFRGGYSQPDLGNKLWGLLVDLACVGILAWVASGWIMWWRLPRLRAWGALALSGGVLSFMVLIWTL